MAQARQYNVDGEDVSLEEILLRTKLARGTIRGRLEKGMRTWASLGEDPQRARKRNQNNLRRLMFSENQARQASKGKGPLPSR